MGGYIIKNRIRFTSINLLKTLSYLLFVREKTEKKSRIKLLLKRSQFALIFTSLLLSSPTYSAIIETQDIIHGTAPYFTFDKGKTKATDGNTLLSIKLSDGRVFTPDNNPTDYDNPIELPAENQTFVDIEMFIPVGKKTG
ncbi:hypothetical protein PT276_10155 [Orbaceae bacterium ESL0721]|nr:hypothetical protein [Orbaceae bacterium ESL0721]